MVKVVGIDPGTKSFDLCGLEDGKLILDKSIDCKSVIKNPKVIVETIKRLGNVDLVLGPSGYGLPLVSIDKITNRELFLLTLKRKDEIKRLEKKGNRLEILGMTRVIKELKELNCKVVFCPSVIQLATVPKHKKINKIDMGTSDKLCSTALAVYEQANRLKIDYSETSFIMVEMGHAFNAVIGVKNGKIVDGIGGSSGSMGFRSIGFMDSELAYLLSPIKKMDLYYGGVCSVSKLGNYEPKLLVKLVKENDYNANLAWYAFHEGIEKSVVSILVSVKEPKEIILCGRLSRVKEFYSEVEKRLRNYAKVKRIRGFARNAKEAAQGAALIADGLANGEFLRLIEVMRIRDSMGTSLDYIYHPQIKKVLRREGIV
jgi:predicted butyrate kinase (DUF1464 family)